MNKHLLIIVALTSSLTAFMATAADLRFNNLGTDDNWTTAANWTDDTVPGAGDNVRFNYQGQAGTLASDGGTINSLQIGVDESGGLTVNFGASLVIISPSGLGLGAANTSFLTMNDGSLTFNDRFAVGIDTFNAMTATLTINDGTFRVQNTFYHDFTDNSTNPLYITPDTVLNTVLNGGLMDVNAFILNSGVYTMVAGAELVIRSGDVTTTIAEYVGDGRMVANGGTINAVVGETGWTYVTVVPEPSTYALLSGLLAMTFVMVRRRK
jgi:hypothetical protein